MIKRYVYVCLCSNEVMRDNMKHKMMFITCFPMDPRKATNIINLIWHDGW